jgi:tRNA A37 threonylcarbamoyladenosine modification protein TsaB
MFLLIDMSQFDKIHLALFDAENRIDKTYDARNRELLFCIDELVRSQESIANSSQPIANSDIEGIMVVVGSGSFTSERIGCVVANTFAYVREIPLLAISIEDVEHAQDLISNLLKHPKGQFISATYSGEPNIGRGKK